MIIWLTIAECLGTDGEFFSETYLNRTAQEAGELACSLMADMCQEMDIEDVDPTTVQEIGPATGEWFYRVRVEGQEFPAKED